MSLRGTHGIQKCMHAKATLQSRVLRGGLVAHRTAPASARGLSAACHSWRAALRRLSGVTSFSCVSSLSCFEVQRIDGHNLPRSGAELAGSQDDRGRHAAIGDERQTVDCRLSRFDCVSPWRLLAVDAGQCEGMSETHRGACYSFRHCSCLSADRRCAGVGAICVSWSAAYATPFIGYDPRSGRRRLYGVVGVVPS